MSHSTYPMLGDVPESLLESSPYKDYSYSILSKFTAYKLDLPDTEVNKLRKIELLKLLEYTPLTVADKSLLAKVSTKLENGCPTKAQLVQASKKSLDRQIAKLDLLVDSDEYKSWTRTQKVKALTEGYEVLKNVTTITEAAESKNKHPVFTEKFLDSLAKKAPSALKWIMNAWDLGGSFDTTTEEGLSQVVDCILNSQKKYNGFDSQKAYDEAKAKKALDLKAVTVKQEAIKAALANGKPQKEAEEIGEKAAKLLKEGTSISSSKKDVSAIPLPKDMKGMTKTALINLSKKFDLPTTGKKVRTLKAALTRYRRGNGGTVTKIDVKKEEKPSVFPELAPFVITGEDYHDHLGNMVHAEMRMSFRKMSYTGKVALIAQLIKGDSSYMDYALRIYMDNMYLYRKEEVEGFVVAMYIWFLTVELTPSTQKAIAIMNQHGSIFEGQDEAFLVANNIVKIVIDKEGDGSFPENSKLLFYNRALPGHVRVLQNLFRICLSKYASNSHKKDKLLTGFMTLLDDNLQATSGVNGQGMDIQYVSFIRKMLMDVLVTYADAIGKDAFKFCFTVLADTKDKVLRFMTSYFHYSLSGSCNKRAQTLHSLATIKDLYDDKNAFLLDAGRSVGSVVETIPLVYLGFVKFGIPPPLEQIESDVEDFLITLEKCLKHFLHTKEEVNKFSGVLVAHPPIEAIDVFVESVVEIVRTNGGSFENFVDDACAELELSSKRMLRSLLYVRTTLLAVLDTIHVPMDSYNAKTLSDVASILPVGTKFNNHAEIAATLEKYIQKEVDSMEIASKSRSSSSNLFHIDSTTGKYLRQIIDKTSTQTQSGQYVPVVKTHSPSKQMSRTTNTIQPTTQAYPVSNKVQNEALAIHQQTKQQLKPLSRGFQTASNITTPQTRPVNQTSTPIENNKKEAKASAKNAMMTQEQAAQAAQTAQTLQQVQTRKVAHEAAVNNTTNQQSVAQEAEEKAQEAEDLAKQSPTQENIEEAERTEAEYKVEAAELNAAEAQEASSAVQLESA